MDHSKNINHLSLCTGYGGLDLGVGRALPSLVPLCSVEIEAFALHNLVQKIEAGLIDPHPLYSDLKTLDWQLFRGSVDLLSGGFPCQPFSQAGAGGADSDPRHLFPYIKRGISVCRPALVFLENVEGLVSSRLKGTEWADPEGTPVLLHVLRELERLGYEAEAGLFSAEEVGASHRRNRVFILGVSLELSEDSRGFIDDQLSQSATSPVRGRPSPPAPRGWSQWQWEPCRVSLGDPDDEGSQGGLLGGESEGQPSEPSSRSSEAVDDSECQGSLRREAEVPDCPSEGRECSDGPTPPTSLRSGSISGPAEPSMGRGPDGHPRGLDLAKLSNALDSRVDELRLLGNGVVPATAEKAFRTLWARVRES